MILHGLLKVNTKQTPFAFSISYKVQLPMYFEAGMASLLKLIKKWFIISENTNSVEIGVYRMIAGRKTVFISYSWAVQDRVIDLAERLMANGVNVIMDTYELKEGQDKYAFMEQSVSNPSVDRVLIICDKTYTEKANSRSGGVGDETVIISPEIYGQAKQEKFIPIAFEVNEDATAYIPAYLRSRIYIDLTTEANRYEAEYEKLLRNIYEKPLRSKPALGETPEWLEEDAVDLSAIRDIVKQMRGYTGGNPVKSDYLLRKATVEFASAAKQYFVPEGTPEEDGILSAIDQTKSFRDLFVEFLESLVYSGLPMGETISLLIEQLYNDLHYTSNQNTITSADFELYDFIIWELFIVSTATMLYFEKYDDLHDMLVHPYFLRFSSQYSDVEVRSYCYFRTYFRMIEGKCKPKSSKPHLHTLAGQILIDREKRPILTSEALSNADLVLYQLSELLPLPDQYKSLWFPITYVYHSERQVIWKKLQSLSYCKKIMPLFGVNNLNELREMLAKSAENRTVQHPCAWEHAPNILSSVKIEDIGSLS